MNCICGCGTRLGRSTVGLNLLAGEVALELVIWDKARALRSPLAAAEIESILAAGGPHYQRLLAGIHADERLGEGEREAIDAWLRSSRAARLRLGDRLPVVPKKRVKLSSEDEARIDRVHPERSFSGPAGAVPTTAPDLEALLTEALADVRSGRVEEAERALRRFLSE